MDSLRVGDLIQYSAPTFQIRNYMELLNGKVGIVKRLWNKQRIAYIEWGDNSTQCQWVPYGDLKLLNRE